MKSTTAGSTLAVPRLTTDPDLPDLTSRTLRAMKPDQLLNPDPASAGSIWSALTAPLRRESGILCACAVAFIAVAPKIEASLLWTAVGLASGAAAVALAAALAQRGRGRARLQLALQSREQYVLDQDLSRHAGQLLARADRAVTAVLRSRVHLGDQLDRQRNNLLLPAQRWEVAQLLRTHNRLERSLPEQAQGDQVRPVLEAHRTVLDQALQGIERRVAALETYAEQAAEADRRYAELTQLDQVSAAGPELLELMARSVRDDLAVAEVADLTARTTAVTDAFTNALAAARTTALTLATAAA